MVPVASPLEVRTKSNAYVPGAKMTGRKNGEKEHEKKKYEKENEKKNSPVSPGCNACTIPGIEAIADVFTEKIAL
jgi:hypothetical protein